MDRSVPGQRLISNRLEPEARCDRELADSLVVLQEAAPV
jgi:hypothetical protein